MIPTFFVSSDNWKEFGNNLSPETLYLRIRNYISAAFQTEHGPPDCRGLQPNRPSLSHPAACQ